jgi:hypothetical protein
MTENRRVNPTQRAEPSFARRLSQTRLPGPTLARARCRVSRFVGFCFLLMLVLVACARAGIPPTGQPQSTTTAVQSTTTAVGTTVGRGLDLAGVRWVTAGLDGLRTDGGVALWPSVGLFEKAVARDRAGGLVFVDDGGLWRFSAGEAAPLLVAGEVPPRVVEVVGSGVDAVAALGFDDRTFVRLSDGTVVAYPGGARVAVDGEGWEIWSGANGWSVWVEGPVLAPAEEGSPSVVKAPAHLMVAHADGAIVVDVVVGTAFEPWVRLHDFDGQTLILSRGPIEPAMPEETFLVVDLSCDICTATFTAAASSASLTGDDPDWNGPLAFSPASLPTIAR